MNGVSVAPCTTQIGCEADTAPAICTTGADVTKLQCDTLAPGYSADADFIVSAEGCPVNTAGTNVPAGDCTPNAGYHGVVSATTTAPFWATNDVNGADVQLCTSQTGCGVDTAMTCTTGTDKTRLQCTTLLAGYSTDANFMVSPVACPANTNGASVVAGCAPNAGYDGTITATSTSPYYAVNGVNGASVVAVACPTNTNGASVVAGCTATTVFSTWPGARASFLPQPTAIPKILQQAIQLAIRKIPFFLQGAILVEFFPSSFFFVFEKITFLSQVNLRLFLRACSSV